MTTSTTTATQLINAGLMRGGLQSITDAIDGNILTTAFNELNFMLDAWSSEISPLYNLIDSTVSAPSPGFTLVPGQAAYTVGVGQLLNVRPPLIWNVFLLDNNNVSYYQEIILADEYSRVIYKVAPGRPYKVYINYQETTLTMTFYPTPAYTDVCHVIYYNALSQFVTVSDTVVFPPGYQDVFINGLAIRLANYFGKQPPPSVVQQYYWGKNAINSASSQVQLIQNPMPTQKHRFFNILTGTTN